MRVIVAGDVVGMEHVSGDGVMSEQIAMRIEDMLGQSALLKQANLVVDLMDGVGVIAHRWSLQSAIERTNNGGSIECVARWPSRVHDERRMWQERCAKVLTFACRGPRGDAGAGLVLLTSGAKMDQETKHIASLVRGCGVKVEWFDLVTGESKRINWGD